MSPVRDEGDALVDDLLGPLDGEAGPARRISRQKSAALVLAAMEAGTREASARPKPRRKLPQVWLVTGAVLLTSAAAAAVWRLARTGWGQASQATHLLPEASANASAGASVAALESVGGELPAPSQIVPAAPAASAGPQSAAVDKGARPRVSPGAAGAGPNGTADVVGSSTQSFPESVPASAEEAPRDSTPAVVRKQRPGAPARVLPAVAPEDLLREANALRAGSRWKDAESLYLRVIREQPSSLAAYVARVASGSLRLEHLGNARGALRQFQDARRLQPQGVLGQEVRHGIAEAWRALGDRESEARALEDFLTHHPDSPLVTNARARLRELVSP